MGNMTAMERLERATKSLQMAEERLTIVNDTIPKLEVEIENLIVRNELEGYKGRTLQKAQSQLQDLEKEQQAINKTIAALRKALPELERNWRLELAGTESLTEYRRSLSELQNLLTEIPTLDEISGAIDRIAVYADRLSIVQQGFFAIAQKLNTILIQEGVQNIGDITIDVLKSDSQNVNYRFLLLFSDDIISLSESLNSIQYELFSIGTALLPIQERPLLPVQEICDCGLHKRIFNVQERQWYFWEFQRDNMVFNEQGWKLIYRDSSKPEFPCEQEPVKPVVKKEANEKEKLQPVAMVFGNKDVTGESPPPVI